LAPCFLTTAAFIALAALPAAAQSVQNSPEQQKPATAKPKPPKKPEPPDNRRWELSFHLAFGGADPSGGGSGSLPGAGEAFLTNGGSPSRRVTSWSFGDGAVLLNDVLASFGRPERIVPLDGMLTSPGAAYSVGDGVGVSLSRKLATYVALEGRVDVAQTSYTLNPGAIDGIRETSNSFLSAMSGLAAAGEGALANPVLSSSFSISNGTGLEFVATGALVFKTKPLWRLRPYAVFGGGVITSTGEATGSLVSQYAFQLPSGGHVNETDEVTIHMKGGFGMVGVAGGGLNFRLTRASGIQVDGRFLMVENHMGTRVDTRPVVESSTPPDAIWSDLNPGIQFVTNPSTGLASNLSAPALSGSRTLSGSGFDSRVSLTVGYYFRF